MNDKKHKGNAMTLDKKYQHFYTPGNWHTDAGGDVVDSAGATLLTRVEATHRLAGPNIGDGPDPVTSFWNANLAAAAPQMHNLLELLDDDPSLAQDKHYMGAVKQLLSRIESREL